MDGPRFNQLTDPPRFLPLTARLRLLLGGGANQTGWFLLVLGLLAVKLLSAGGLFDDLPFTGDVQQTHGVIMGAFYTDFSENERDVIELAFRFQADDGLEYSGFSYTVDTHFREGDTVQVEYLPLKPETARVMGTRAAMIPLWLGVFLVIPFIGVLFLLGGQRRGWKWRRLLRDGEVASGRLVAQKDTGMKINEVPVIEYIFEFRTDDGDVHRASARTHKGEKLRDEGEETLFYDPRNPDDAVLVDGLPLALTVDERGQWQVGSTDRIFLKLNLVFPVVAVLMLLWIFGGGGA